ncbi:MAG: EthD family reductase [Bacteroidota bacterium]
MKLQLFFLVSLLFGFTACSTGSPKDNSPIQTGMVKVSILYPNGEGHTFDMDYYAKQHMPMVAELFGEPLRHYAIEEGIGGRTPADPIPYLAIGYFYFDQLTDYENAFGPNAEQILGDIPNYTNVQAVVQISKVVR